MESSTKETPMTTDEIPQCAWSEGFRQPGQEYEVWRTCLNTGDHEMSDGTLLCTEHADDHWRSMEADLRIKGLKERQS